MKTDNRINAVPHLTTALSGPLHHLEKQLLAKQISIESWLREQWRLTRPPFYASVDLRNAGFKVAPVDTNIFPAGFNNLNPEFMPLCIQAVQATIEQICPDVKEILIVPENHTRNLFYLESVAVLREILMNAGFAVRIGSLLEELTTVKEINLPSGKIITLEPLLRNNNKVGVDKFFPDLILLNNDLSAGIPEILQNLQQRIMPPLHLGWATRSKSLHFQHYQNIALEFADIIKIDPWLLLPLFRSCGEVDFMTHQGEECLVGYVDILLQEIREKYQQYDIKSEPFVVVKADTGTYGMAVMMIKDSEQLRHLNRKQRTSMAKVKSGKPVTRVIIQEGIPTIERIETAVAEPVVYMIGRNVVGGFYRMHNERGEGENLNAPGAQFQPLAFATACNTPCRDSSNCDEQANRFYIYGVIARLALLAAARELAEVPTEEFPC